MSIVKRLNSFLEHALSPAPVFYICIGFWLPLEFLQKEYMFNNFSIREMLTVIGYATLANFGFAALLLSVFIYMLAGFGSWFRLPVLKIVRFCVRFSFVSIFMSVSVKVIWVWTIGHGVSYNYKLWIVLIIFSSSFYLAWKQFPPWGNASILKFQTLACLLVALIGPLFELFVPREQYAIPKFQSEQSHRPDIVLITIDSLSAKHIGSYGYNRATSPNINGFASDAILLERCYANANWTQPGIASLFNGTRPWTHNADRGVPDKDITTQQNLINLLYRANYNTMVAVTNSFASPVLQGISSRYYQDLASYQSRFKYTQLLLRGSPAAFLCVQLGPNSYLNEFLGSWSLTEQSNLRFDVRFPLSKSMEAWERREKRIPAFLWIHLFPPHAPYACPQPYQGMFESSAKASTGVTSTPKIGFDADKDPYFPNIFRNRYDESVRYVDEAIGTFLDWLKQRKEYDKTIVAITADHGESFGHNYGQHGGPLLSEDLIRIPCVIKPPFQHHGVREARHFEQIDLAPTLLQLAGIPIPQSMEGVPLSTKASSAPVFAMNRDYGEGNRSFNIAIVDGPWKYVEHHGQIGYPWPSRELYHLPDDPEELTNVADIHADTVYRMQAQILMQVKKRGLESLLR